MKQMDEKPRSLRRVAILIDTLSEEIGDHLLSQMPLDKAANVRQQIDRLTDVDAVEREQIIDDFLQQTGWKREDVLPIPGLAESDDAGVELQLSGLDNPPVASPAVEQAPVEKRLAGPLAEQRAAPSLPTTQGPRSSSPPPENWPLGFVTEAQALMLAELIQGESEQLGAVMLSLLKPSMAANVLRSFAPDHQARLLRRLAHTRSASPEVVTEIVQTVERWLGEGPVMTTLATGWQAVQQILTQAGWSDQQQLWNKVQAEDKGESQGNTSHQSSAATVVPDHESLEPTTQVVGPLKIYRGDEPTEESPSRKTTLTQAEPPSKNEPTVMPTGSSSRETETPQVETFPQAKAMRPAPNVLDQVDIERRFDGLQAWPAKTLVKVLKQVPPKVMTLAMTGAHPKLLAVVKKSLARREAARLQRDIERSGPVRLADICKAQQAVLAVAEDLHLQGEVKLPGQIMMEA